MDIQMLYLDREIAVCIKPVGVESEGDGMPRLLAEQLQTQGEKGEIFPVHRLDTAVGGVMVFARTKQAAGKLSALIAERKMTKEYLCVVKGQPEETSGVYRDLLFKDSRKNKSFVVQRMRKGVKEAELSYETLGNTHLDDTKVSLIRVHLHTGRSHQIRVQFASRKMPLLGDGKYGSTVKGNIALFSTCLAFPHPISRREMSFSALPASDFPWTLFEEILSRTDG